MLNLKEIQLYCKLCVKRFRYNKFINLNVFFATVKHRKKLYINVVQTINKSLNFKY